MNLPGMFYDYIILYIFFQIHTKPQQTVTSTDTSTTTTSEQRNTNSKVNSTMYVNYSFLISIILSKNKIVLLTKRMIYFLWHHANFFLTSFLYKSTLHAPRQCNNMPIHLIYKFWHLRTNVDQFPHHLLFNIKIQL